MKRKKELLYSEFAHSCYNVNVMSILPLDRLQWLWYIAK